MNAKSITWSLANTYESPFYYRRALVVVPNVSWGLLPWEADLIHCSKGGYLSEIEIKVSMTDWKADLAKQKFKTGEHQRWIKGFWYAAPAELAARWEEVGLPTSAGIIAIADGQLVKVLRYAKYNRTAKMLSEREILALCRLGAIKAWDRHNPKNERVIWDEETAT